MYIGDQYFMCSEVKDDIVVIVGVIVFGIIFECGSVQNFLGFFGFWILFFGNDEQVMIEQVVLCGLGGYFNGNIVIGIGVDVQVGDELVVVRNVFCNLVLQCVKFIGWERMVNRILVNQFVGVGFFNDVMIYWRMVGVGIGVGNKGIVGSQLFFIMFDGLFDQKCVVWISINFWGV